MECKACKKDLERHSSNDLEKCMVKQYGTGVNGAYNILNVAHITTQLSQPSPDKRYFEITLNNGSVIKTYDLAEASAKIILGTEIKDEHRPKQHDEHEQESDEIVRVDTDNNDGEGSVSDSESTGVDSLWRV